MTRFFGLGHYARTGKDTFANYLITEAKKLDPHFPIKKVSFAYKLKQICHELYAWAGHREPEFYETEEGAALREVVLPAIGLSPRQVWIKFGTDAVRNNVYVNTWRDYLLNDQFDGVIIVTDVRFPDEFDGLRERGAHLIKFIREGYIPKNGPDLALQKCRKWDRVIINTGFDSLRFWAGIYAFRLVKGMKTLGMGTNALARSYYLEDQWLKYTTV